jgi:hypothetical protein
VIALALEKLPNEAADVRVVVDDQHVGARHAGSFPDGSEDPFPERIRAQAMP